MATYAALRQQIETKEQRGEDISELDDHAADTYELMTDQYRHLNRRDLSEIRRDLGIGLLDSKKPDAFLLKVIDDPQGVAEELGGKEKAAAPERRPGTAPPTLEMQGDRFTLRYSFQHNSAHFSVGGHEVRVENSCIQTSDGQQTKMFEVNQNEALSFTRLLEQDRGLLSKVNPDTLLQLHLAKERGLMSPEKFGQNLDSLKHNAMAARLMADPEMLEKIKGTTFGHKIAEEAKSLPEIPDVAQPVTTGPCAP